MRHGQILTVSGRDVPIPIAHEGLLVVLGHLLRNASEHAAQHVGILATQTEAGTVLEIADDGRGVSAGNAAPIFEPFFTTRRDAGGTGMGLAIVRNILAAHRGVIEQVPTPSGARFRIMFGIGR